MLSKRGNEYLAGALFIGVVATIVGANASGAVATAPVSVGIFIENVPRGLVAISEDRSLYILSTIFDLAANLITIPLAAMAYIVFRSHDRTLALLGSFGLLAAALLSLTRDMSYISLLFLAQDFAGATGAQIDAVLAASRAVGIMLDASFAMGSTAVALGVFSYGLLVLTTSALPRWIGVFGVLGGIVAPFGWLLFLQVDLAAIGLIGLQIALFFALLTGIWLIAKGTRQAVE